MPTQTRQKRAQEQFPQVLLGVLGIIQALALELLWERGVSGLDRWHAIDASAAGLTQVVVAFLGVVLVWVVFATMVLRFRWTPRFRDLLSPFVIGALEFLLVDSMAPELLPRWFLLMTLIFITVSAATYTTFESAIPMDEFGGLPLRDRMASFLPSIVSTFVLLLAAIAVWYRGPTSGVALASLMVAGAGLLLQLLTVRFYWYRDLEDAPPARNRDGPASEPPGAPPSGR